MLNLLFTFFWKNFLSSSFNNFFMFSFFRQKAENFHFILLNAKTFLFVSLIYFSLLFYGDERGFCYFSIFIFIFIFLFVQNEKKITIFYAYGKVQKFILLLFLFNYIHTKLMNTYPGFFHFNGLLFISFSIVENFHEELE